jgi:PAS domain S-box-containing protein
MNTLKYDAALKALLDTVTESAFLMDIKGTILWANATTAQRLGKSVDDLVGTRVYDYLPADLAKSRKKRVREVIDSGTSVQFEDRHSGRWTVNTMQPVAGARTCGD